MEGSETYGTPESGPRTPRTECRHCGCSNEKACVWIDGEWYAPNQQNDIFRQRVLQAGVIETCAWESHFVCSNQRCIDAELARIKAFFDGRKAR